MAIRIEESPTRGILPDFEPVKSTTKQKMWNKLHRLFGRDDNSSSNPSPCQSPDPKAEANQCCENQQPATRRNSSRRVGVGLPRQGTFRRLNSEKRHKLEPIEPCRSERRAVSAQRQQRAVSAYQPRSRSSPTPQIPSRVSAPSLSLSNGASDHLAFRDSVPSQGDTIEAASLNNDTTQKSTSPYLSPSRSSSDSFDELARDEKHQIDLELDTKWILNLSMHFRDKSDREKFFITYAEKPNRWRRVTISCDYRNAEPDSLEMDLKELQYQRDKNAQIYESIRDSLASIQFYKTVTNLKLETEHGRLHVHVTEDVNEVIPYPPRLSVQHILTDQFNPIAEARECEISFLSHLSGFVYKVSFQGREYIKKEIPGPDTVDEFLYEVNALHALSDSACVIKLEAVVLDDSRQTVKGLLISYAERGALVDLLYDHKGNIPWADRMRWSRQAIQGLSEVHEEGYVQGDFTLSNIVVDHENNARIIDINRRGCPVGWEPPEIVNKIASNQRISMYIGQKSDLYQLGMTLWALTMDEDEPERHDQPLSMEYAPDEVPDWFKDIVDICLSPQPRNRLSAKELLRRFPPLPGDHTPHRVSRRDEVLDERLPKRHIEPYAVVEREDLERLGRRRRRSTSEGPSSEDASLIEPPSSSYQFDSGSSFVGIRRGRRPPSEHAVDLVNGHRNFGEPESDAPRNESELSPRIISISPGRQPRYEGIDYTASLHQGSQSSAMAERSTTFEPHLEQQPCESDTNMTNNDPAPSSNAVPEARHDSDFQAFDGDLDLPNPNPTAPDPATTSITSESTPRNATSAMAISTISIPAPSAPDLATEDLAGFGGNPVLGEYSPHEPMKLQDSQISQYYDSHAQLQDYADPSDGSERSVQPEPSNVTDLADGVDPSFPELTSLPADPAISSIRPTANLSEEKQQSLSVPSLEPAISSIPPTAVPSEESQHLPIHIPGSVTSSISATVVPPEENQHTLSPPVSKSVPSSTSPPAVPSEECQHLPPAHVPEESQHILSPPVSNPVLSSISPPAIASEENQPLHSAPVSDLPHL